ncbi:MAG TPA: GH92 family glycosyl hydrolase [Vicinamibacteria bacterium]
MIGPAACALLALAGPGSGGRLLDLVRPIVGTARRDQRIGAANSGQTFPAVGVPFGMTHWTPQTQASEDKCVSPYYAQDERLQGIRASHFWSGSCTQDYGSATLAAVTGPLRLGAAERASPFARADEVMTPAYYAATLADHGVRLEVTGTARAGILRFTFLREGEAAILVHANRKSQGALAGGLVRVDASAGTIEISNPVQRIYAGSGKPAGFSGHTAARIEAPFEAWGTWDEPGGRAADRPGVAEQAGEGHVFGGYARFRARAGQAVIVRAGTSFTSVLEARRNREAEIGRAGFDEVRARAEAAWEAALGRVRVRGGTDEETQAFYTALYHALLMPRLFGDASGTYPRFAGGAAVETARGFDYYDDFSLWDTFRAQHPLLVLLQPERVPDFAGSLLAKADQGGFLPNFPGWNSYTSAMIGDHGASVIADAWVKGVRGFDGEKALAALVKNATVSPPPDEYADGKGRRALSEVQALGFIPLEQEVPEAFHRREQVSRTLEYAYDDFAVAALARSLGRADVAATFERRAARWRNVFDSSIGFVRGRHADGRWVEAFDPAAEQPWITEGTPWHYSFFVPHDVPGLVEAMGGREAFVARLDRLFAEGRYWHGNEPSHHVAYLYAHAGAPWRTQEEVRRILATEYGLGPAGLQGNDDTGQMSAWYVFSALGFYPVCPGSARYEIGSPLFEEARIDVGGGRTFTVLAPGVSAANLYVQSAALDGRPHERPWIAHEDVARGATLELRMGPRPNRAWGARPEDAPPSALAPVSSRSR